MKSRKQAFTLIELLVVVAIIAVLIAILIPSLGKARDRAKAVSCASNERNIYQGINLYAAEYNGMAMPCVMNNIGGKKNSYWYGSVLLGAEWGKNAGFAQANSNEGRAYMTSQYWEMEKKFLHCPADTTSGDEYRNAYGHPNTYSFADYSYNYNVEQWVDIANHWSVVVTKLADIPPNSLLVIETHQGINIKGEKDAYFKSISDLFVYKNSYKSTGYSPMAGRIHNGGTSANMLFADGRIILDDPLKMDTTGGVVQPIDQPNSTSGTDHLEIADWSKPTTHPFPF